MEEQSLLSQEPLSMSRVTRFPASAGFTVVEVLISALLIAVTMGSILSMNVRSIKALRASREAAASSQVLQQRIEMIRKKTWAEVSSSTGVAKLMATATESEVELADSRMVETLTVTAPQPSATGPSAGPNYFSIRRSAGAVVVEQAGNLFGESTLFFDDSIVYRDTSGVHRRTLRSIVCRAGLTRPGLYGSVLGRPGSGAPASGP